MRQFGVISRSLDIPYDHYKKFTITEDRAFQHKNSPDKDAFTSTLDGKQLKTDFGTVCRIVNPKTGNLIILLNGSYGAGLLGAALAVSDLEVSDPMHLWEDGSGMGREMVIKVSGIMNNAIDRSHRVMPAVPSCNEFVVPIDLAPPK